MRLWNVPLTIHFDLIEPFLPKLNYFLSVFATTTTLLTQRLILQRAIWPTTDTLCRALNIEPAHTTTSCVRLINYQTNKRNSTSGWLHLSPHSLLRLSNFLNFFLLFLNSNYTHSLFSFRLAPLLFDASPILNYVCIS